MSQVFDVTVIGAGPGGYVAAIRAAQMGLKTAIVEGHKMGGECLNYGCIPSKALIYAAHVVDSIKHGSVMGILCESPKVDMNKLIDWKGGVVKKLTGGVAQLLKANGVTVFRGQAQFDGLSADGSIKKISVNGSVDPYDQGKGDGQNAQIESKNVIIASGSVTAQIPTFKIDGKKILGSREALEVKQLPKKLVVIGGGVIGLEIGMFYAKLGTAVSVVEGTPGLLPGTDKDCVQVVEKKLQSLGVKVFTNAKALGWSEKGNSALVDIEIAGKKEQVEGDWVLLTVGRKPRTAGLNLEKIALKTTERGFIEVNNKLQTKVPGVYAIGDVIGGAMLAHKASKEGLVAVDVIMDPKTTMDARALPWAIFTDPEIAGVGHTVESAKAAGWDPVVGKCPFAANGRAVSTEQTDGFIKIISDKKTDRILGAHMVGPDVSNLVAEVALAIEMGATTKDLTHTIHAHPTLPETLMEAAESVHGMAVHFYEKKARHTGHGPVVSL